MTAEVAVMNKSAIALAADSAVTRRNKIYNTANKLFRLSDHHSVGVMVYGGAAFMGIPWESLIKMHRSALGVTSFDTLQESVDEFTTFLRAQHSRFSKEQREKYVRSVSVEHLQTIKAAAQAALQHRSNDPPDQVVRDAFNDDCFGPLKANFEDMEGLPQDAREQMRASFLPAINELVTLVFHDLHYFTKDLNPRYITQYFPVMQLATSGEGQ